MYRYCYECVNKATGERKCIVCGGHRQPPYGKMILCELCPRAYHHDCYIPPMIKVNRNYVCQCCPNVVTLLFIGLQFFFIMNFYIL